MVVEVIGWSEVGNNGGADGFRQHFAWGGRKKLGLQFIKQRQHHDVRAQHRDVPEGI